MKKLWITSLSVLMTVCLLLSAFFFLPVGKRAFASTGNITDDASEKPLDSLVEDGGLTSIFEKIAVVGDSLSSGALEDHQAVGTFNQDVMDYSWGQFMARTTGSTVYNLSRSGMSTNEYCESFATAKGFWDAQYASDAYYVALGFNDLISYAGTANGLVAGTVSTDVNVADYTQNAKTFAGYMGQILSRYQTISPNAAFFLLTMPMDSTDGNRIAVQNAHAQVLNDLAALYDNTYVIDLRQYAPKYDANFVSNYYVGGHLSTSGYLITAKMVMSYTDYIIRHNTDAFRALGLTVPNGYTHTVKPVTYDMEVEPLKYQQLASWNTAVLWSGIADDVMTYVDSQWNMVNPGVNHAVAITFTAPTNGTVISDHGKGYSLCTVYKTNTDGADGIRTAVYLNDQKIFPAGDEMWFDPGTEGNGANMIAYDQPIVMEKGDKLHFLVDCGGNGDNDSDSTYLVPGFFWSDDTYTDTWFDTEDAWWTDAETDGNTAVDGFSTFLRKDVVSYNAITVAKESILPVLADGNEVPLSTEMIDGGMGEIIRTAGVIASSNSSGWINEYSALTNTDISVIAEPANKQAYFISLGYDELKNGVDSNVLSAAITSSINAIKDINDDAYFFLITSNASDDYALEQQEIFSSKASTLEKAYLIDLYTYGTDNSSDNALIAKEIAGLVDYTIRQNMADFKTFGIPKMPAPADVVENEDKLLEVNDFSLTNLPAGMDQGNLYWTGAPNDDPSYVAAQWNTACPSSTYAIAIGFTAPIDGSIYPDSNGGLGGAFRQSAGGDGARFAIYLNQTKIYPADSDWVDVGALSMNVQMNPFNMKAGDTLYYIVENGGNGDYNYDGVNIYIGFHWVDGVNNTTLTWYDTSYSNGGWWNDTTKAQTNSLGFNKGETVSYHYVLVGDRYDISYDLNGGVQNTNPTVYSDASLDFAIAAPTKDGYNFVGWTGTGLSQATTDLTIQKGSTGDKAFVANWEAISYTITYDLGGGTNASSNPATYTVESDAITFAAPTKEGYTFVKWTIGGAEATGIAAGSTGNVTVTAVWQQNAPEPDTTPDTTPDDTTTPPPADNGGEGGGCGSAVTGSVAVALAAILGGAFLAVKKYRKE